MTPDAAAQAETAVAAALAELRYDDAERIVTQYVADAGPVRNAVDPASEVGFRAAYLAGQVAANAGRLAIAHARLAPLAAFAPRLPSGVAARLHLLLAEADGRRGRHRESRDWLERVPDSTISADPLFRLRAARVRLWAGAVRSLGQECEEIGRALAVRGDDRYHALLLTDMGRAWEAIGELDTAAGCWEAAVRLVRTLDPDPIRAYLFLQLGRLAHLRGDWPGALDHFDTARDGATPPQRLELDVRSALVAFDLGRTAATEDVVARLRDVPATTLPDELRPLIAVFLAVAGDASPQPDAAELIGYRAARVGDVRRARLLYREAIDAADGPERRARLALGLGELAVAVGDWVDARNWLEQAVALAAEFPEVLARGLEGLGRIAAERDVDEATARDYFERAVAVVRTQAARFAHATDAAAYRERHLNPLRQLLRSAALRDDPAAVFALQELERGRLLLELWLASGRLPTVDLPMPPDLPSNPSAEGEVRAAGTPSSSVDHDRALEAFLRSRSRRGTAAIPMLPDLNGLRRALPRESVYLAPSVIGDDVFLLAVDRNRPARLFHADDANRLREEVEAFQHLVSVQVEQYESGFGVRAADRANLDAVLDRLGDGPLGHAIARAFDEFSPRQAVWVPTDPLHAVPVAAVRINGRYLVEQLPWLTTFGGSLYVHHRQTRQQRRGWWRSPLVVAETPDVLAGAAQEGRVIAGLFHRTRRLSGTEASRSKVRTGLARSRLVHFACHAYADPIQPLASAVGLPGGEQIHAVDWLGEPVAGLGLAALSACRSAAVGAVAGAEVFGPAVGLLAAGVRAVLASLWKVADTETLSLMQAFYRHRRRHDLATALTLAQREGIADSNGSPLFWAAFALYGDPDGLTTPLQTARQWITRLRGDWL